MPQIVSPSGSCVCGRTDPLTDSLLFLLLSWLAGCGCCAVSSFFSLAGRAVLCVAGQWQTLAAPAGRSASVKWCKALGRTLPSDASGTSSTCDCVPRPARHTALPYPFPLGWEGRPAVGERAMRLMWMAGCVWDALSHSDARYEPLRACAELVLVRSP